jgi:hypothetical protein
MNEAMRRLINDVASGSVLVFVADREDGLLGRARSPEMAELAA